MYNGASGNGLKEDLVQVAKVGILSGVERNDHNE